MPYVTTGMADAGDGNQYQNCTVFQRTEQVIMSLFECSEIIRFVLRVTSVSGEAREIH